MLKCLCNLETRSFSLQFVFFSVMLLPVMFQPPQHDHGKLQPEFDPQSHSDPDALACTSTESKVRWREAR